MSEAGTAVENPPEARPSAPESGLSRVIELKVSGQLMTLDAGVYCVFQMPAGVPPNDRSGLPGVRLSLPPGPGSRPGSSQHQLVPRRRVGGQPGRQCMALVRVANGQACRSW